MRRNPGGMVAELTAQGSTVVEQKEPPRGKLTRYRCPECPLRQADYFCDLSIATLQELQEIREVQKYAPGRKLFVQGQKARGAFMVCQGRVKLTMSSVEGKTLILRLVREGEILGLGCTISGARHEFTAEAMEPCRISFIERDAFRAFARKHNDACGRVIQQLASKCTAARERVRSLALSHSAESRLARLLLDWSAGANDAEAQGASVMPPLDHETVAEMIGTSRETVTRLLKRLKQHKIVEIIGQHIIINNAGALEVLAATRNATQGFTVRRDPLPPCWNFAKEKGR